MTPIGSFGFFPLAALNSERTGPAELLRIGFVTSSCYELRKFRHGDFMLIDPERFYSHFVNRSFIFHAVSGAHQELSALDEHHAVTIDTCRSVGRRVCRNLRSRRTRGLTVLRQERECGSN